MIPTVKKLEYDRTGFANCPLSINSPTACSRYCRPVRRGTQLPKISRTYPPKKIAKIGNKLLYKYDDWKITFVDGKVTEIDF